MRSCPDTDIDPNFQSQRERNNANVVALGLETSYFSLFSTYSPAIDSPIIGKA